MFIKGFWIPACAEMTGEGGFRRLIQRSLRALYL